IWFLRSCLSCSCCKKASGKQRPEWEVNSPCGIERRMAVEWRYRRVMTTARPCQAEDNEAVRAHSSTAEQGTHNPLVRGSNPLGPNDLRHFNSKQPPNPFSARTDSLACRSISGCRLLVA